jgi:hypothetical protein
LLSTLVAEKLKAETLALAHGFKKVLIETERFGLLSFQKSDVDADTATIYIEGDGFAFLSPNRISPNPTPKNPVSLNLAVQDNSANVLYLARPCQFVSLQQEKNCSLEYWTNRRYASEVIQAVNSAIDQYLRGKHIKKIRLVGHSGGATVAALIAAGRMDVLDLRTLAGNLDIVAFVRQHDVTPLSGSLNPVMFAKELATIPQKHFLGSDDEVITANILDGYLVALRHFDPNLSCVQVETAQHVSHTNGWGEFWRDLPDTVVRCRK